MQPGFCTVCRRENRVGANYCAACGKPLHARAYPVIRPGTHIGRDGRYQVLELIGKGGFGEAYLAEDTRLQRRLCLVKHLWIKPGTVVEEVQRISTNFAREASLLIELNTPGHPNIPEIYEYVPEERCLVMKYITGQSLDRVLKRRVEPLPEEEALRYVRDACAALKYMHTHRAGEVLHRDLKPSNIMLDTGGRIWLIDFGLARSTPIALHPVPGAETGAGGTYGYAPPEQWAGKPVPHSDIFALGATLYELLTGRHPPRPDESLIPARTLNPALRPEVDAIILRCLSLRAQDRPDAAELLSILDELLASANIPPPPEPVRPPPPPIVLGRTDALHDLEQRLRTYRCVALVGMPGIGKTTLAAALADRHPQAGAVFWHRFHPAEGVDLLVTRLAGWLAQRKYPAIWQQIQRSRQAGQSIVPELLAEYLGQSPGMHGCLICLDDLHVVADDPTMRRVFERLRTASGDAGPAIVLTTRTLPGFIDITESVRIAGLTMHAAQELLAQRGLVLTEPEFAQLWRATEGNPQFLTLAADALRRGDDPHTLLTRLQETDRIEQYLLHEVDAGLTQLERRVMSAVAALLGYGGSRSLLEAMIDEGGLRRILAALVERQLLIQEQRGQWPVYIQHAMVQAFYYDMASLRERRELHRRAGAYYEQEGTDRLSSARHYLYAGEEGRAAQLLTQAPWELFNEGQTGAIDELAAAIQITALQPELRVALWTVQGEAAVLLGKDSDARQLLERALAAETDGAPVRRARRYRLLAQLYERSGDHGRAEEYCRHGLALADQPGAATARTETARLYAQLAEILMRRDDTEGALAACDAGLEALPPEPAAPAERAALLQRIATITGLSGAYLQAIMALEQSLGLARQAGDSALTARVLHNLGHFCYYSGRLDEALPYLHESRRIKEQIGDHTGTVDTLTTLGLVQFARGATAEALHYYQIGRSLAEQWHLRGSLASILHNIGLVHYESGDLDAAEAELSRAAAMQADLGETGEQAHCLYLLGDVAIARGHAEQALAYGRHALELAQQTGRQPLEACALRVIGEAHLMRSEPHEAEAVITQAWALAQAIGDPYDLALILAARAQLSYARGNIDLAGEDARWSLAIAREQHMMYLEVRVQHFLQILTDH